MSARAALEPLLGIAQVLGEPDCAVIIVSDAQDRNAGQAAYGAYTFVALSGAIGDADLAPLRDRRVYVIPRAQLSFWGWAAELGEALSAAGARVAILDTHSKPDDWDVLQAVTEGLSPQDFATWLSDAPPLLCVVSGPRKGKPNGAAPVSTVSTLQDMALDCNAGGVPDASIANTAAVMCQHPGFTAQIWWDDFRRKIMVTANGITRHWTDADDLLTNSFLTHTAQLRKVGLQTTMHAVQLVAFNHRRNSVTSWLDTLDWDGEPRLSMWLSDFLGAPNTAYQQSLGRNWLISMVARAYRPGCQVDHMPVLEGAQGRGKSSALAILGGEYYRAAPQAFGSKEFFEVIQGAWLIEIPDMVGFGRREHSQIIAAITTRSDPYRASYGRHVEDHPRTTIFVATSESDEYLKDTRGVRRYWPVRCADINLAALSGARDQLFAEAAFAFKAGAHWHAMPRDATNAEQAERQESDPWLEDIERAVTGSSSVTVSQVCSQLNIELSRRSQLDATRIARCLKILGFSCRVERVGKATARVYRR